MTIITNILTTCLIGVLVSCVTGFLPANSRIGGGEHSMALGFRGTWFGGLAARSSRNPDAASPPPPPPPWKQQPGESEFAYLKRLQQLASRPTQDFVFSQNTTSTNNAAADIPKNKHGGYVPIETWNEQTYKKTNLTAEERLQFDCQRHGDRFKQNQILKKNLDYFG